jgi:biopolymer transport protein ExbD
VRLVPDRDLPAAQLVALGRDLAAAGASSVRIVTERALD